MRMSLGEANCFDNKVGDKWRPLRSLAGRLDARSVNICFDIIARELQQVCVAVRVWGKDIP